MQQKKIKKIKTEFRKNLINFQWHGIPKLVTSDRLSLKVIWALFLIIATGGCSYGILNLLINYFDYLYVTNIRTISEDTVPFPIVTICQVNPTIKNYNISDVLLMCTFNQIDCLNNQFFTQNYDRFLSSICYKFKSDYHSIRAGKTNGLTIKLFIGLFTEPRFNLTFNDLHGIQIFINNKSTFLSLNDGIDVQPGLATNLAISRTFNLKLSEPYNKCIKQLNGYSSFNSTLYKLFINSNLTYRQKDCLDLAFLIEQNCYDSFQKPLGKCTNYSSIVKKRNEYYENKLFKKYLTLCPEECDTLSYSVSSTQAYYPSNVEYLSLKSNSKLSYLFNKFNETITIDDIRKSIVYARIYYNEHEYTLIDQHPKMNSWDLVSNLGGVMSLFMGISFLSFIDFIHIGVEFFLILFEKNNNLVENINLKSIQK